MESNSSALDLQGFSYQDRLGLLPDLTAALILCGGWIIERKTISATTVEISLELQLRAIVDLYGVLIAAGIELTRNTHSTLTDLCTWRRHIAVSGHPGQILTLRLELSFPEEHPLYSRLATGSAMA